MKITALPPCGIFGTNSFIIYPDGGKEAALIDAPGNTADVLAELVKNDLSLKYILLTHGHCDHIFSLAETAEKTGAEVFIHENDLEKLTSDHLDLTEFFGLPSVRYCRDAKTVRDGDVIDLGDIEIKVMHTPGHTSGSVMYIAENKIFSGDTLFENGAGRTDMPDGDTGVLRASLKKIAAFEGEHDNYDVYPGHGGFTTLNDEKKYNPYLG